MYFNFNTFRDYTMTSFTYSEIKMMIYHKSILIKIVPKEKKNTLAAYGDLLFF